MRATVTLRAALIWLGLGAAAALAHPLDPALLELREQRDARVEVRFREPLPGGALRPALPARCVAVSTPLSTTTPRTAFQRWQVDCGAAGLAGERVGVDGLRTRQSDALVRIALRDGRLIETVLRPDQPFVTIPRRAGVGEQFRMGFRHLVSSPDHLLFVLALVLLAARLRRLPMAIIAFTLGHSITLVLAALGLVHVPPAPIGVLIAASLVVVAAELARTAAGDTPGRALPAFLGLSFGLLHGFGFAGALAQLGPTVDPTPLSLFAFHLGIESAQLLFVGAALASAAVLQRLPIRWPAVTRRAPAYAIGSLAVLWMLERLAGLG